MASDMLPGWPRHRTLLFRITAADGTPPLGFKAGSINVCLNPMHKAHELEYEFADCGAKVLVTSHEGYAVAEPVRAASPLEAVAVTSYRDYLPNEPALPVPEQFLEPSREFADTVDFLTAVTETAPLTTPEPRAPTDTCRSARPRTDWSGRGARDPRRGRPRTHGGC